MWGWAGDGGLRMWSGLEGVGDGLGGLELVLELEIFKGPVVVVIYTRTIFAILTNPRD